MDNHSIIIGGLIITALSVAFYNVYRLWEKAKYESTITIAARQIIHKLDNLAEDGLEYNKVNPNDFFGLDLTYYSNMTNELVELGYKLIGDYENVKVNSRNPSSKTFLRWLISPDSYWVVSVYHFLKTELGISLKLIEVETELSDGIFLTTSNAVKASSIAKPDRIRNVYSSNSSTTELLSIHMNRIKEYLSINNVKPIMLFNDFDVINLQKRQHVIKSDFRKNISDEIIRKEIFAISGGKIREDIVKNVTDRILKIRNKFND